MIKYGYSKLQILFTLKLCLFLVLSSNVNATNSNLEYLLSYQNMLFHGEGASNLREKHSEEVMRKVNSFITDAGNKNLLKTKNGSKLLENHQKLVNFETLKNQLENCLDDDKDSLMLRQRVIDSAGRSFDQPVPCRRDITKYNELDSFITSLTSPAQILLEDSFENRLNQNALLTSLKTLLKVKYKYEDNFMKDGKLSNKELEALLRKPCSQNAICRDQNFMKSLKEELNTEANSLVNNEKKSSRKDIQKELNKKINNINAKLSTITFDAKERWYWSDYADMDAPENKENKEKFQGYIGEYLKEASTGNGTLLLTDTYKDHSGSLKSYDDDSDNIYKKGNKFHFKKHKPISRSQINSAVKEVKRKINDQINSLKKLSKNQIENKATLNKRLAGRHYYLDQIYKDNYVSERRKSIQELIKTNPVVAGQTLLKNPEYSTMACSAIGKINEDKEDDDDLHEAAVLIGAIGGGLLIATGVGAVAGGWLLTGSLTAGVAAGTVGGSVLAATTTSALILGGAESAYFSNRAYDKYNHAKELDRAILSQTADDQSVKEQRDEVIAFKEARFEAALALGFTAIDLGAIKGISTLAKSSKTKALSTLQRKNLQNIYKNVSTPRSSQSIKETIKLLGKDGAKEFDQFLGVLSLSNKKWQKSFLKQLEAGELDPKKMKKLSKAVLEAKKKCSK